MRTRSKTARPRSTMSRWPFVIGSNEPGKTASEPSGRFFFTLPPLRPAARPAFRAVVRSPPDSPLRLDIRAARFLVCSDRPARLARAPVEAQAVVADALLSGASEGAYCLRKRHACGSAPPPPPRPPREGALHRAARAAARRGRCRRAGPGRRRRTAFPGRPRAPIAVRASCRKTRTSPPARASARAFSFAASTAGAALSTRTTFAAPRESASSPTPPLPAKASRKRQPGMTGPGCRRATAGPARRSGGSSPPPPSSAAGPSPPPR